jgi:Tol biopolymer transport system component
VAAVAAAFLLRKELPVAQAPLMRLTLSFPDDVIYSVGEDFVRSASISPDGRRVVFTGNDQATGTARLFVRMVDSTQSTPLQGSEDGTEPFWSPDSKSVGFYSGGKVRIASIEGGIVRELADAPAAGGASWNGKGQVLLSLKNPGPLMLVPAAGGTPKAVTALEKDDVDHDWPQFLDDDERFLYMVNRGPLALNQVYLASLARPGRTLLLEDVPAFAYAPPDRVIFLRGPVLYAQVLDLKQGRLVGEPAALAENALPPFSASRTGALTYRSVPRRPNPLLWIDTEGKELGEAATPGYYSDPQISPEGKRVALAVREAANGPFDVAILDLETRDLRRLTVNAANDRSPVWSPDGQSIVYVSMRPDAPGLYRKNANGVGTEQLILPSPGTVWPYQWKPGRLSIFDGITGELDIAFLTGSDLSRRETRIDTPANDVDGAISPDGKWLAYTSNASGRWEIYLTTVEPSGTVLPLSTEGACDPTWSTDGRTLYYTRPSTAELMAVSVLPGDPPTFGKPRRIHHGPLEYPSGHSLDVSPDGKRLLLAPSYAVQGDLTVLVNWQHAVSP